MLTVFVDNGSDVSTVNEISKSVSPEILEKAMDKSKLVQKEISVTGRHGVYKKKVWVRSGEDQPKSGKPSGMGSSLDKEFFKLKRDKIYVLGTDSDGDVTDALVVQKNGEIHRDNGQSHTSPMSEKEAKRIIGEHISGKSSKHSSKEDSHGSGRSRDFQLKPHDKKYNSKRPNVPYLYIPNSDPSKALTTSQLEQELMVEYSKNKGKYNCSYHEFRNGPKARQFVKDNYFISDGATQTEECYMRNGEYTPERKKLHDSIIKAIVDSANTPPKGQKPVAVLMGGGSASGKGTLRSSVVIPTLEANGIKAGISDSDDIKSSIPEYKHFQDQHVETAAYRAHEESSYIADRAIDEMVKQGKNLLFDGTMKNYDKYTKLIDKLHDAGYEVQIIGADVPLETAIERSDKRAEHTGRKVPHGIIEGSHRGFAMTLPKLMEKADSTVLYDNSGDDTPRLILADGEVKDQQLYDRFIKKGNDYRAKKEAKSRR